MHKLWNLPIIGAYIYSAAVLVQLGYTSYFDIPPHFVEASLKQNIIYFFNLFLIVYGTIRLSVWWVVSTIALIALIIFIFYLNGKWWKYLSLIGVTIAFLVGSYHLGNFIASHNDSYLAPGDDCIPTSSSTKYIVPMFYETKAILVPYDINERKILRELLIREATDLPCALQHQETGVLKSP